MRITKKDNSFPCINQDLFLSIENLISSLNSTTIIIPHVCNNADIFGGGFTAGIVKRYPVVQDNYHMLGLSFLKKNFGHTQFILAKENKRNNNKIIFANMIAQNGTISKNNPRPLNYLALCKSMVSVSNYIKTNIDTNEQEVQIHAPKFGSGLAGGNWNFIKDLISDIWSEYNIFIYDPFKRK